MLSGEQAKDQTIELITNQFKWTVNTIDELNKVSWEIGIFPELNKLVTNPKVKYP